jgi:glycosyltransferase involved in cell wall biosynthesis
LSDGIDQLPVEKQVLSRGGLARRLPKELAIQAQLSHHPRTSAFHATGPYSIPLIKTRLWICTIQDTITLDLQGLLNRGIRTRAAFRRAQGADMIITNSGYTSSRVAHHLDCDPSLLHELPLPVAPAFENEALDQRSAEVPVEPFRFVAMIDGRTVDSRKRNGWTIQVANELIGRGYSFTLVGRGLPADLDDRISVVEAPSDAQLIALYRRSSAFYYASAYEGQGLPPLEAMACGCPAVYYRNSAVSEMLAGTGFGLDDPNPWEQQDLGQPLAAEEVRRAADALLALAADHPARKVAKERAQQFSLRHFAKGLGEIYSRLDQ